MHQPNPGPQFGKEAAQLMANYLTGFSFPMIVVFLVGLVQGIRFGFDTNDYLFLLLGSFSSVVCAFIFSMIGIRKAAGKPVWTFPALVLGNLPYLFLIYLAFYRGIWGGISLLWGFSLMGLLAAAVFILVGFAAIKLLVKIAEANNRILDILENQKA